MKENTMKAIVVNNEYMAKTSFKNAGLYFKCQVKCPEFLSSSWKTNKCMGGGGEDLKCEKKLKNANILEINDIRLL